MNTKKPARYTVALTVEEANLIDDALSLLGRSEPARTQAATQLRLHVHKRIARQLNPKSKKKKAKRGEETPWSDALNRRVPGSFGSRQ